ncbi:MAG: glycerol-3-phosphate dehydrogenase/oxidase [Alphaproteobacteria bacterium]|nr:glycerol-3-phosphate dehydrogenase/oxidase [Alphaproteobacteria bacterium]
MKRNFPALGSTTFDVTIVGGGITGSCVARDAARRGLSVALIEKRDFSCGTSSGSSKLVHGGLRYLKSLEFGLIRESLRERRVWEKIAPHMVYPLLFMLPVHSQRESWIVGAGLTLYDLLSYDRNRLDDPDQHMRAHWAISKAAALEMEPALEGEDISGALLYYDCQMHSPERLGLECLIDAVAHGAVIANYAEAVSFEKGADGVGGIRVRDALGGEEVTVKSRVVVNAAGPWADRMLEMIEGGEASHKLIRSKGIHIVTDARTKGHALTISHKGGHFFVLPWREHTIFGTTDSVFNDKPDSLHVTREDIDGFIAFMNEGLPGLKLSHDDVRYAYAGLRPLVDDGSKNSYNASRKAEIVDHGSEGGPGNLLSAIGGKWTTSRDIGEKCVDLIARKLGATAKRCDTGEAPLPGATGRFKTFVADASARHKDKSASVVANLARNYGARADDVLALTRDNPQMLRSISQRLPDIAAQVAFAVRSEMAMTLDDVLFRRTGLGTLGKLEANAVADAAALMAAELKWSDAERQRQVESIAWRYTALAQA